VHDPGLAEASYRRALEQARALRAPALELRAASAALPKDSVATLSQLVSIDKTLLGERSDAWSRPQIRLLFAGLAVMLGR